VLDSPWCKIIKPAAALLFFGHPKAGRERRTRKKYRQAELESLHPHRHIWSTKYGHKQL
jgi:hypothetical protein